MQRLKLATPVDAHLHLRDGDALAAVLPATVAHFASAVVMPNLQPPVRTTAQALAYRDRIVAALPAGAAFTPWMTLYLTDTTPADEMAVAKASGAILGVKLYPAGATTHSDAGVRDLGRLDDVLAAMAAVDLPLLVHGEVTDPDVDIFDREAVFLDRVLQPLRQRHPRLRLVLEHVTSAAGVAFVAGADDGVAATVTPQHLRYDRNAMLVGGIRPHLYCLPILKARRDREALLAAATSGSRRWMLGSDSAPHAVHAKESACGCAGCYSAPVALPLYAEAFEEAGALARLDAFASRHFAAFHGLPSAAGSVTLVQRPWVVPQRLPLGSAEVRPLCAGETLRWQVEAPVPGP